MLMTMTSRKMLAALFASAGLVLLCSGLVVGQREEPTPTPAVATPASIADDDSPTVSRERPLREPENRRSGTGLVRGSADVR